MSKPLVKTFANSGSVITRFTVKTIIKGALLFGILAGMMTVLQGLAYSASYPDLAARQHFVATLESSPALGILYGNPAHAITSVGYIVYRTLPFLSFVAGIWGLLVATRLLRGAEEDGRWELLLTGQTTAGRAVWRTAVAMGVALIAVLITCSAVLLINNSAKDMSISVPAALYFGCCIATMSALCMAVGSFTSQLAATRRRATLYGLIPLVGFFVIRGLSHIMSDGYWLSAWTPFGWLERAQPLATSKPLWLLPPIGAAFVFMVAAGWIASRRDLGDSIIAGPDIVKPRYALLSSIRAFTVRNSLPNIVSWGLAAMAMAGIIAALAKTAVEAVGDSDSLADALTALGGGNNSVLLAFIGMGTFFVAAVLMAMAANGVGMIRAEEAKSYLDNVLVRPVSRSRWLTTRIVVLAAALVGITILSNLVVLACAKITGVAVDASRLLIDGLNILGPIGLLLGVGILCYGWLPRWASKIMYVVFGWSFVIDMVGSVVDLDKVVANTSLFHQISLAPAASVHWLSFVVTLSIGVVLALVGIFGFAKRDLQAE